MRGFDENAQHEAFAPLQGYERNVLHVDFLYRDRWVYWIDYNRSRSRRSRRRRQKPNGIYRIKADGSGMEPVIASGIGLTGIRGLAVDWVAKNIYFSNVFPSETFIEVARADGKYRKVLFRTTVDSPRQIAVNPIKKYLYWTDYGQYPKIERSLLDGTQRKAIVTTGISTPRDLCIDPRTHDVYWVDSRTDTIESVDYKGGSRQTIRGTSNGRRVPSPYGLAIFRDKLYFVDRNLKSIFRMDKIAARNRSAATPDAEKLRGM